MIVIPIKESNYSILAGSTTTSCCTSTSKLLEFSPVSRSRILPGLFFQHQRLEEVAFRC